MIGGSLFSNIGLLDYGLSLAGVEHAWGCESDPWRRAIWERRFRAPCYPDIRELRGDAVRPVGLVAGGFPCKGVSTVGKREGFEHPETVLWREMARAIGELRPRYVVVENVANILALHDGAVWGEVLADLASLGFDVEWDCLPAAAVGAPHLRDRVFAVATHAPSQPERVADDEADAEPGGRLARQVPRLRGAEPTPDPERRIHGRSRRGDISGSQGAREGEAPERQRVRADAADGPRGVSVEWGAYEPAIRRWEALHGPAPEPLIRGVDVRASARVVRSRLSALGDGVQVQVGYLVGRYVLERERVRQAA